MQPSKRSAISEMYVNMLTMKIRMFFTFDEDIKGALLTHYIKWLHHRNKLVGDHRLDSTMLNLYDDMDARREFVLSRFDSLYAELGE